MTYRPTPRLVAANAALVHALKREAVAKKARPADEREGHPTTDRQARSANKEIGPGREEGE